jgi:hypothetical protein
MEYVYGAFLMYCYSLSDFPLEVKFRESTGFLSYFIILEANSPYIQNFQKKTPPELMTGFIRNNIKTTTNVSIFLQFRQVFTQGPPERPGPVR